MQVIGFKAAVPFLNLHFRQKQIRGGSASYEKSDEWFEERREIRRIKREFRHSIAKMSYFQGGFELMSYGIILEQPVLRRSYLKKLVKAGKKGL